MNERAARRGGRRSPGSPPELGRRWTPLALVERSLGRREKRRLSQLASIAFAATGVTSFLFVLGRFDGTTSWSYALPAVLAIATAVLALVRLAYADPRERLGRGRLQVDGGTVLLGLEETTRRLDVLGFERGYVGEGALLVLEHARGETLYLTLEHRDAGAPILAALGLSASSRPLEVTLISRAARVSPSVDLLCRALVAALVPMAALGWMVSAVAAGAVVSEITYLGVRGRQLLPVLLPLALALMASGGLIVVFRYLRRSRVVIGADGVELRGAGPLFIPYAEITAATPHPRGATLELASGERVALPVLMILPAPGTRARRDDGAAILARIAQARASARRSGLPEARLSLLDRGEDATTDRAPNVQVASYRHASLEPDELVRVVDDALELPARRVVAASALLAAGSEHAPAVWAAARSTANTDLRRRLEACAAGHPTSQPVRR